jgi:hypothetical protein
MGRIPIRAKKIVGPEPIVCALAFSTADRGILPKLWLFEVRKEVLECGSEVLNCLLRGILRDFSHPRERLVFDVVELAPQ